MTQHQYLSDEQIDALAIEHTGNPGIDLTNFANAAIAAYVAKGAEPVAWRSESGQITSLHQLADCWRQNGGAVVPLYAAPLSEVKAEPSETQTTPVMQGDDLTEIEVPIVRNPPFIRVDGGIMAEWSDPLPSGTYTLAARQASPQQGAAQSEVADLREKVEDLFGRYWDIAYDEARNGINLAHKANGVLHELRTLLAASASTVGGVPAGWKLVPVDPTEEMLTAAAHASMQHLLDCINDPARTEELGSEENIRKTHASRYQSMLAAAPSSPAVEEASSAGAAAQFRALLRAEVDAVIDPHKDIAQQEAYIDEADHLLAKFNELFPE